jgi:hypothetical protein
MCYTLAMTLTVKAMETARRNLVQRIERLLAEAGKSGEFTGWQADQLLEAIRQLEAGAYPEGERTMMRAELPHLYEPKGYMPQDRRDVAVLVAALERQKA